MKEFDRVFGSPAPPRLLGGTTTIEGGGLTEPLNKKRNNGKHRLLGVSNCYHGVIRRRVFRGVPPGDGPTPKAKNDVLLVS